MKNRTLTRMVALLLAGMTMISFAACNDDASETKPETTADTETVVETKIETESETVMETEIGVKMGYFLHGD